MDLKQLLSDDDAASPVIGVTLMVAVTVILAAVIATFVLGIGDGVNDTAPQATFSFDYNQNGVGSDELTSTHEGGEIIDGDNLNITSTGASRDDGGDAIVGTDVFTGEVHSGTTANINNSTFKDPSTGNFVNDLSGDSEQLNLSSATVRVIYIDRQSGNSATLGRWEGPDT